MNFRIRFKNPVFIVQLILAILTPILAYMGLTLQDLTSWSVLFQILLDALKSPYVLSLILVSVWNALNDPTTAGLSDSALAMTYKQPKRKIYQNKTDLKA